MNKRTKSLLIVVLVAIGVVDFCVFRSNDLYRRAREIVDPGARIPLLQRAQKIFPWNDFVCYELGQAQFELGMQGLNEGQDASPRVKDSVENLERSLRINPASPFGHFYYAQSLQFASLLTQSPSDRILVEFQNAARLAGENREILYDVGKRLLARWKILKQQERDFAREILATALQWEPVDKFPALLNLWHLNVGDVGVLESILPEDPDIYRMFGNYLGEKSMSVEERHRILSRADQLEFAIQKRLLAAAYRELELSHWDKANMYFGWCLNNLQKIRFYHKISGFYPLEDSEFHQVFVSANLGMARSVLESGGGVEDAREYLMVYLENEDDGKSLRDLESRLAKHKVSDTSIQLFLYHKQGRYQDIIDAANKRHDPAFSAKSLYIIGDAYHRMGMLEDAAAYFRRSLETDARNVEILLPIRQFYRNTNNDEKILYINDMIEDAVVSKEKSFADLLIVKHKYHTWQLPFEGGDIRMDLYFRRTSAEETPLITVVFNQEVVWDDFLEEESLSIPVKTVAGKNVLRIATVNHPVILRKMSYSYH